jgi:hypothetical protein
VGSKTSFSGRGSTVWNKHWPTSYSSLISSLSTTHSFPFPLLSLSTPYYLPSSFIDPPPPFFRPLTPCPTFDAFPSSSSKWKEHEISVSCAGNMTSLCPSFAQDLAENLQLLGRAREMSEVSGAQSRLVLCSDWHTEGMCRSASAAYSPSRLSDLSVEQHSPPSSRQAHVHSR